MDFFCCAGKKMQRWCCSNPKQWFVLLLVCWVVLWGIRLEIEIPSRIKITSTKELQDLSFPVTLVQEENAVEVLNINEKPGTKYSMICKLFGMIPVKKVTAEIVAPMEVYASGRTVGIYLKMEHILVIDKKELITLEDKKVMPAEKLQPGDYICEVNKKKISKKEELAKMVNESEGRPIVLGILRKGKPLQVTVRPVQTGTKQYQIGAWIKDDIAGVGTMTYITEEGEFGALGHGINDSDTGVLLKQEGGYLYETTITEIKASDVGDPGELTGIIAYGKSHQLGQINDNQGIGIHGELTCGDREQYCYRKYQIGRSHEVQPGKASLLFGTKEEAMPYEIMITKVFAKSKEENKSFVFHITDEELIHQTGGIIQGMSGSPIIQDGKIIGAVTHVFVNDPSRGYGIFIEEMLEN